MIFYQISRKQISTYPTLFFQIVKLKFGVVHFHCITEYMKSDIVLIIPDCSQREVVDVHPIILGPGR